MLPDSPTPSADTQDAAAAREEQDAVAIVSLEGCALEEAATKCCDSTTGAAAAAAVAASQSQGLQLQIEQREGLTTTEEPAQQRPGGQGDNTSTEAAAAAVPPSPSASDVQDLSTEQPSTPSGWKGHMFNSKQQQQQQQQQQVPALPPGCLMLDGEALRWHSYEEDDPQQQQQQRSLLGCGSDSGASTSRDGCQQQQQQQGLMHTSCSTPNLVLLADGSQELQPPSHQPHTHHQQQQLCDMQPMHSSQSCDSLLSLCYAAPSINACLAPPVSSGSSTSGAGAAAAKSRLGRPIDLTSGQQQQQQQQVADRQLMQQLQQADLSSPQQQQVKQPLKQSFEFLPAVPPAADTSQQTISGNWDRIQQQQQQQEQQRQRPSPPPDLAVGLSSGSAHVTSWTFDRCNSGLSLGGSEALGRRLRVHCTTFNMNGKLPASLPREVLGECGALADVEGSPDLLVFATQENASISDWEKLLSSTLGPGGYERLAWHSLRAIHLVLYAGRRFRRQVLGIHGSAVATGIGNVVGNKGAVALSVELLDLKLLFISSHLAAHGDQVQRRNDNYQRIKAGLFAAANPATARSVGALGSGHSTSRSPRAGRSSVDLPRPQPMSAPSALFVASDSGTRSLPGLGDGLAGSGFGGGLSGRTGSLPWGGFIRSNRVADCSAFEEAGRGPGLAARKQVSWWAEQSPGGLSPSSCSSPLLAIHASAPSEGQLAPHHSSPAAAAAVAGSDLNRLRVSSCPFMEQQQSGAQADSSSFCSSEASSVGTDSPVWGGSGGLLSPGVDRGCSTSSSFLRSLGKQSGKGSGRGVDALESHDVVFWLGDLNYRINGNSKAVRHLMRSRLHEVLHANDQLRLQQKMGTVFQGFQEGRIRFPPTFKFLPGSSAYSEKRVPSWTDRILWKVRSKVQQQPQQQPQQAPAGGQSSWASRDGSMSDSSGFVPPKVSQLYYTSVPEVTSSDHKPVISGFEIAAVGEEEEEDLEGRHTGDSEADEEGLGRRAWRIRCCMM